MACTPGASAKTIRTDLHVDGKRGLRLVCQQQSLTDPLKETYPIRTRFSSGMIPGGRTSPFPPASLPFLAFLRIRRSSG